MRRLARDAGISQATGYRYLHEAIDVLADQGPDLHRVLHQCQEQGVGHVVPDGTLIACDRVAGTNGKGTDEWYSGKAKHFAGNLQSLAAPDDTPLWVFEAEPGSGHDLTCARTHALPAPTPCPRPTPPRHKGCPPWWTWATSKPESGSTPRCAPTPTSPAR